MALTAINRRKLLGGAAAIAAAIPFDKSEAWFPHGGSSSHPKLQVNLNYMDGGDWPGTL